MVHFNKVLGTKNVRRLIVCNYISIAALHSVKLVTEDDEDCVSRQMEDAATSLEVTAPIDLWVLLNGSMSGRSLITEREQTEERERGRHSLVVTSKPQAAATAGLKIFQS